MTTRSEFTTHDVERLTGLTKRQIHYWDKVGFIKPSEVRQEGRRSKRVYLFVDLVSIKAALKLLDAGLTLQKVRFATQILKEQLESHGLKLEAKDILAKWVFVTDGERVFKLVTDPPQLIDVITGQTTFLYAVRVDELANRLANEVREMVEMEVRIAGVSRTEMVG